VYYNADAFAKAGIVPPQGRVESIDAWYEMSDTLTAAGLVPLSTWISDEYGAAFMFASLLQSSCGTERYRALENSWRPGTASPMGWTDPCVMTAVQTMFDFGKRGVFGKSPGTMAADVAYSLFVGGKSAMYSSGGWEVATFAKPESKLPFEYGWFLLPPVTGGEKTKFLVADLDALGVSSRSEHKDLAIDYIRTMATREFQASQAFLGTGRIAGRTDIELPPDAPKTQREQFEGLTSLGSDIQMTVAVPFHAQFAPLLAAMLSGQKTPSDVANALESQAAAARGK
jgi:raffinose/stachyose/melibiose transport system substrate-binding protein